MSHKYRGHKANRNGKACVMIIVIAMVAIMSVQIAKLYEENQQYIAQEANLKKEKKEELKRKKELKEYEAYTQTQDYIEEMAKSKLGLVYKDEIIFKEQKANSN